MNLTNFRVVDRICRSMFALQFTSCLRMLCSTCTRCTLTPSLASYCRALHRNSNRSASKYTLVAWEGFGDKQTKSQHLNLYAPDLNPRLALKHLNPRDSRASQPCWKSHLPRLLLPVFSFLDLAVASEISSLFSLGRWVDQNYFQRIWFNSLSFHIDSVGHNTCKLFSWS